MKGVNRGKKKVIMYSRLNYVLENLIMLYVSAMSLRTSARFFGESTPTFENGARKLFSYVAIQLSNLICARNSQFLGGL